MESGKSIRWIIAAVLPLWAALSALFFAPLPETADASVPADIDLAVHLPDHVALWGNGRSAGRYGVPWSGSHRRFEPSAGGMPAPGALPPVVRTEIGRCCERLSPSATDDTMVRPIRSANDPVRAGPLHLA